MKRAPYVMSFQFGSMRDAYAFENALRELALEATAIYQNGSWVVRTNTNALAHAAKLYQFIYRPKGGR